MGHALRPSCCSEGWATAAPSRTREGARSGLAPLTLWDTAAEVPPLPPGQLRMGGGPGAGQERRGGLQTATGPGLRDVKAGAEEGEEEGPGCFSGELELGRQSSWRARQAPWSCGPRSFSGNLCFCRVSLSGRGPRESVWAQAPGKGDAPAGKGMALGGLRGSRSLRSGPQGPGGEEVLGQTPSQNSPRVTGGRDADSGTEARGAEVWGLFPAPSPEEEGACLCQEGSGRGMERAWEQRGSRGLLQSTPHPVTPRPPSPHPRPAC